FHPSKSNTEPRMKLTACIIDDDLVSQFATRYCIQQSAGDFEILTCSSGEEGLQMCFDRLKEIGKLPDLVFLDLIMDGMSDSYFLEYLQELFQYQDLPRVYVLSAFVNARDRAIARGHSLKASYIDKPLVRSYVEKNHVQEQKRHQNNLSKSL